MSTPADEIMGSEGRAARGAWQNGGKGSWWSQRREASLNWLAFGVLLAAWNASNNDTAPLRRRPEALRGYSYVSVRAVSRHFAELRRAAGSTGCSIADGGHLRGLAPQSH